MQYSSMIYFRFSNADSWKYFLENMKVKVDGKTKCMMDFKDDFFASWSVFSDGVLIDETKLDCLINCDLPEDTVDNLVNMIASKAGKDVLVVAYVFNLSVDPATYELYYFGDTVHSDYRTKGVERHLEIDIKDVEKWLGPTRKKNLTAEERAIMKAILNAGS